MTPLVLAAPRWLDGIGVRTLATGLESAASASVVVVEGTAECFCLGMDLATITNGDTRHELGTFARLVATLATCPRPTIAVVEGPALGGGLGLAAACDYVLATSTASFGLPEALYGLAPAIIRPALRSRLSAQRLRMLVLTGYARSAAEAARFGLCDEVVEPEVLDIAKRRAIRNLARARDSSVAALRRWHDDELARMLAAGIDETTAALADSVVRGTLTAEVPWQR